jgi:hypothetical protein
MIRSLHCRIHQAANLPENFGAGIYDFATPGLDAAKAHAAAETSAGNCLGGPLAKMSGCGFPARILPREF